MHFYFEGGPVMVLLLFYSILLIALLLFCLQRTYYFSRDHNSLIRNMKNHREAAGLLPEEIWDLHAYSWRRAAAWLAHLANISTLSGLLGTVLGVYITFRDLESAGVSSLPILAGGIKQAIITTIVGLCLALPALIAHYYFREKYAQLEARIVRLMYREMEAEEKRP